MASPNTSFLCCSLLVILHAATGITISTKSCLNDVSLGSWWGGGCVQKPSVIPNRIRQSVERHVVAQEKATDAAITKLESYLQHLDQNTGKAAPTFHMVGANGVGKGSFAQAIGRAFSTRMENGVPSALLSIPLEGYTLREIEEHIYKRLKDCGQLILLMDDINKYKNIDIVLRIVKRYPIAIPGKPTLSLDDAIILLTSDFGSERNEFNEDYIRIAEQKYSNSLILVRETILVPFAMFDAEMYIRLLIHYLRQSIACLFKVEVHYEYEHLSDYVSHYLEVSHAYKSEGNAREFINHLDAVVDGPIRSAIFSYKNTNKALGSIEIYKKVAKNGQDYSMSLQVTCVAREKSFVEKMTG